jgi:hypothetical protein
MPKRNEKSSQYTVAKARQFEPEQWREGDGSFTGITVLELPFCSPTAAARLALQFPVTNERRAW